LQLVLHPADEKWMHAESHVQWNCNWFSEVWISIQQELAIYSAHRRYSNESDIGCHIQIFILYAAEGGIELNLVYFRSILDRTTPP
jgi:hypothetical protein